MRSARAHRRQPVRDDQHGAVARDAPHVLLDHPLALIVERARRLVEDEDARVAHQRTGDGDALALAARQARAALANDRLVTLRQFEDELVRAGERRRRGNPLDRHAWVRQRDVVTDRTIEEDVLLQHDPNLPPEPGGVNRRDIDPVDEHAPAFRDVEPLYELRQRRLAGSGRPDDADDLAGRDLEGDIVQRGLAVEPVAEGHVVEADRTLEARQGATCGRRLRHGVQNVAQALDRDAGLVKILPDLSEAQDGLRDAPGQHVEGDELADRQVASDDGLGAEVEDRRRDELAQQLDRLAANIAEGEDAEASANIAGELLLPAPLHLRLDRHGLQRLDARERFDEEGLILCPAIELFLQTGAEERREHD